jgi:Beta-glucanase/Beta-glucan synthetase
VRDDFNTPAAEGQFLATYPNMYAYPNAPGWLDSPKNGHYDPAIISVHGGMADAFIRTTNGIHRIAAFGPKLRPGYEYAPDWSSTQLYGRYEVRFKVDSMHGYKGAWLLWPQSDTWPRDGEIDFPEGEFDSTMWAFVHHQGATSGGDQDYFPTGQTWTSWHVAVTEWTPTAVRFYLDGALIGTSTQRIPNTPMRWIIQNETTNSGYIPADSVQGHVYVDYVAVWAYVP